jgi:hypothetical protein
MAEKYDASTGRLPMLAQERNCGAEQPGSAAFPAKP